VWCGLLPFWANFFDPASGVVNYNRGITSNWVERKAGRKCFGDKVQNRDCELTSGGCANEEEAIGPGLVFA
jgi:hypothetical protein